MTNHPGRKPGRAPARMTPDELRDLINRAGMTQARAAELAGVQLRTMQQYLAGDRAMPVSASAMLCVACIMLGAPATLLLRFIPGETAELIMQATKSPRATSRRA